MNRRLLEYSNTRLLEYSNTRLLDYSNMRMAIVAVVIAFAAIPATSLAQLQPVDTTAARPLATRSSLENLVSQMSGKTDAASMAIVQQAKTRLQDGDFRPRDLIILEVEGEPTLTDTFTVGADRSLELPSPTTGKLELRGVLRSELEPTMITYVRRFVRDARVRAQPMVRIWVQGEVARPGFHGVPANALLSEALMAAGGTTTEADTKKSRVERNGRKIWSAAELDAAITSSRTIDEIGLLDGDRIVFEKKRATTVEGTVRFAAILVSLLGGLYGLSRVF